MLQALSRCLRLCCSVLDELERGQRQLVVDGRAALVRLTPTGIEWTSAQHRAAGQAAATHFSEHLGAGAWCHLGLVPPACIILGTVRCHPTASHQPTCCLPRCGRHAPPPAVPFSEMLSARKAVPGAACCPLPCLRVRLHRLEIATFRRSPARRCEWAPRRVVVEAADEESVEDLAAAIGAGIQAASAGRPRCAWGCSMGGAVLMCCLPPCPPAACLAAASAQPLLRATSVPHAGACWCC